MKYRNSLLVGKLLMGLSVLVLTFISSAPVSAKQQSSHPGRQFVPLLRKSTDIAKASTMPGTSSQVTIRLNGLQATDFVNIRPKVQDQVSVAAGTLIRTVHPGGHIERPFQAIRPGTPLSESSLKTATNSIVFDRPVVLDQIVFLDIEVPHNAKVRIIVNGETTLKASLRQPLSFHNQEWGEGASSTAMTLTQAAGLSPENTAQIDQPLYDRNTGYYLVPSSKLSLVKKQLLKGEPGLSAVVILQIDESGRVVRVIPQTDAPILDLEETLMKWRFAPYTINGQAVPVKSMLRVAVQ